MSTGATCAALTSAALLAAAAAGQGPLAARLLADPHWRWRETETPIARLYLPSDSARPEQVRRLAIDVASTRRAILAVIGPPPRGAAPADLFFVFSRADVQRISGRPLAGFIQPGEPTGVFYAGPGYDLAPLLKHELTHLYTFEAWGPPRAGDWLVEGLAVALEGPCQGHPPDALASGALKSGRLASVAELAARFRQLPEDVAFPEAGSLVGYLIQTHGIAGVRALWRMPERKALAAISPVERPWRERLQRTAPAFVDIPAVLRSGC